MEMSQESVMLVANATFERCLLLEFHPVVHHLCVFSEVPPRMLSFCVIDDILHTTGPLLSRGSKHFEALLVLHMIQYIPCISLNTMRVIYHSRLLDLR